MRASRTVLTTSAVAAIAAIALGMSAHLARAQSLLDRPDNISGDWVGNSGTIYFNFVHRFTVSPPPERKVTNLPTFLVASGISDKGLVGFNYATNSSLADRYPNEWEFFARYAPIQQEEGAAFDLGGQVDYNLAVKGIDGELSIARREGPARFIAVARFVADTLHGSKSRMAFGGGGTFRLSRFLALAGDVETLTDKGPGEKPAWSAGIHLALPNTPHTLSLHASNANTSTLQGLARGSNRLRYGFEFTIPLTLRRFFSNPEVPAVVAPAAPGGALPDSVVPDSSAAIKPTQPTSAAAPVVAAPPKPATPDSTPPKPTPDSTPPKPAAGGAPPAAAAPPRAAPPTTAAPNARPAAPPAASAAPAAKRVVVNARLKGMNFLPGTIEIAAGTTVVWKNLDPLPHTVTAVDKSFTSSLFSTDATYSHTFTKPGTYAVYCMAHPFMKATVVVK